MVGTQVFNGWIPDQKRKEKRVQLVLLELMQVVHCFSGKEGHGWIDKLSVVSIFLAAFQLSFRWHMVLVSA